MHLETAKELKEGGKQKKKREYETPSFHIDDLKMQKAPVGDRPLFTWSLHGFHIVAFFFMATVHAETMHVFLSFLFFSLLSSICQLLAISLFLYFLLGYAPRSNVENFPSLYTS
jgi:hypothetical protein